MSPNDFKRAEELLRDPDAEDCERFSSWYGRELLDTAKDAIEVVKGLMEIAEAAMPDTFFASDSRTTAARQFLERHPCINQQDL